MTDQLALPLQRQKRVPPPFICVDPAGIGRPWNGVGRPPDYVRKHLRETGLYPVAKPIGADVSAADFARLEQRVEFLSDAILEHVQLFNQHIRETTKRLEKMQRRIEELEQGQEPVRRAA